MIRDFWDCIYKFRHYDRHGSLIWTLDKKNLLVDEGAEAAIEIFLRGNVATYMPEGTFFIGLYNGTISRTTTIATVPGEPSGNGYVRVSVERSSVGWPTKEIDDDGYWRLVSKEVDFVASGGDIGPITGAFLSTSSDAAGRLISAVSSSVERTILSGETMSVSLWERCR